MEDFTNSVSQIMPVAIRILASRLFLLFFLNHLRSLIASFNGNEYLYIYANASQSLYKHLAFSRATHTLALIQTPQNPIIVGNVPIKVWAHYRLQVISIDQCPPINQLEQEMCLELN